MQKGEIETEMLNKRGYGDSSSEGEDQGSEDAWNDPEDQQISVSLADKARLRKIMRKRGKEIII